MKYRPSISVCIAAYNGQDFIGEQLRSILIQLAPSDQIVVVDDASSDDTSAAILSIHDPRIQFFRNDRNEGVLRAFERALQQAVGEIIFLSDQDDVWLPSKVESVLRAFALESAPTLVTSDATLIDDNGLAIGSSYYATRGVFRSGLLATLYKCTFLGCTMAFRRRLLDKALPFPKSAYIHHDIWLGCVNSLIGGKVRFIEEPLVAYRRHLKNVTGRVRFSTYRRFQMRFQLLLALIAFRFHREFRSKLDDV